MHEEYIKETKIKEKNDNERKLELIISIIKTKRKLQDDITNYEFAHDELIDYYLYNIKANQAKLDYLIKKAKASGISLERINEIDIRKNKVV
ncbi:MAG TPA: YaaL family protein [Clostridiaceae bacterium]|jgi:transcription termination factor NusB|nr:YaaL family protein [Clostridiaceae bacterium]